MANHWILKHRLHYSIFSITLLLISLPCGTHTRVIGKSIDYHNSDGTTASNLPCNASVSFSGLLQESIRDIEKLVKLLFEHFTHILRDDSHAFEWLHNMKELLFSTLNLLENKILSFGDNFLRELIGTALEELKHEFQMVAFTFKLELEALNKTIINNSDTVDIWIANIKDELREVNNTHVYNMSCSLLNDLIDFSTAQLRNCCNITIRPARSLCSKLRGILVEAVQAVVNVLDRIQICLEDKQSYQDWEKSCIKLAFDYSITAIEQLSQIWNDFKTLMKSKLIFKTPLSTCCFSIMVVQVHTQHNWKTQSNKDTS